MWTADASTALRREIPDRLHAKSGDREDWGNATQRIGYGDGMAGSDAIIRGLPFSRAFERYIDHGLDSRHAVVRALWRMKEEMGKNARAFRVARAMLLGDGPDEVMRRMRLSAFAFATAAFQGLATLRTKTEDAERLTEQNRLVAA